MVTIEGNYNSSTQPSKHKSKNMIDRQDDTAALPCDDVIQATIEKSEADWYVYQSSFVHELKNHEWLIDTISL